MNRRQLLNTEVSSNWAKPSGWLDISMPTGQGFVGLYAVFNTDNFVALTASSHFQVDWGDSVVEFYPSTTTAYHNFSYTGLSSDTYCDRGYRQAIVTISPSGTGNLTDITLQKKHNQAGLPTIPTTNWLDIAINGPNLTTISIGGATVYQQMIERINIQQISSGCASLANLYYNCFNLQSIGLFDTKRVTTWNNTFRGCYALKSIPLFNTISGSSATSMFMGCYSLSTIPLFDFRNLSDASSMFSACASLTTIPLLNTPKLLTAPSMFVSCTALKTVPLINLSKVTDAGGIFNGCSSLTSIPTFNFSSSTTFTNAFIGTSISSIPLIITSGATSLGTAFRNNGALQNIALINTSKCTAFNNMFQNDSNLRTVPLLDTRSGTNFSLIFDACSNLRVGALSGTRYTISYANCSLSRDEIVNVFNNLGTAYTGAAQTVTVAGNYGVSTLTNADKSIASGKGWIVA